MYRGTSPQSQNPTQKATPKQSKEEQLAVIAYFFEHQYWERVAPLAPTPILPDGKMGSKINFRAFFGGVNEYTVAGTGKHLVRHDILSEIVISLDQQKLLEHFPQVVERVVEKEVHVPLTRREEQKHNFNLEKLMNAPGVDVIKGASEQTAKKPVVSEAELAAQARHDLNENAVMGDVRSVISGHSHSGSHAATKYEREILTNVMNDGIRKNVPAEKILANVKAKQDAMAKYGPQTALKELKPELFTGQDQYRVPGSAY